MTKILYLEDEEDLVKYLPPVLKSRGVEIISTSSIEEALEKLAGMDFDAVMLDIMMQPPDNMNAEEVDYGRETGIEVARQMKKVKPHTPIIAFTVITDSKLCDEMREAGIATILNKPAEVEQILHAFEQVTRHKTQPLRRPSNAAHH